MTAGKGSYVLTCRPMYGLYQALISGSASVARSATGNARRAGGDKCAIYARIYA